MSDLKTTALAEIAVPGTDAPLMAAQIDGRPMVALRHACESIGLDYSVQLRKLKARSWATVVQTDMVASDGKVREMAVIDRRTLTMWLATVQENRVDPAIKDRVVAYQAEATNALDAYFSAGVAVSPQSLSTFDILRAQIDQLETAQRTADEAKAIATKTEARLDAIEGRHDWYSALGYARLHRMPNTSTQFLNRVGRQASSIAKNRGITPVKVLHQLFGEVNSYPAWIWDIAFDGIEDAA